MDEGKAKARLGTALALARNAAVQGNSSRGLTTRRLKATAPRQRILHPDPLYLAHPFDLCFSTRDLRVFQPILSFSGTSPGTRSRDNRLQMHLPLRRQRSARCIGDVSRRITRGRSSGRLPREPQALLRLAWPGPRVYPTKSPR